ncbi:MAG: hypothetical protein ACI9U2_003490, partial [Bradymonadia bacterium]
MKFLYIGALLALGLLACDDGDEPDPPDMAVAEICVRDAAQIAERRDCRIDLDCPCGAHCLLGLCESQCAVDGDCAEGEGCDSSGRCRPSAVVDRAALSPADGQRLTVDARALVFFGEGTVRRIQVRGASGTVRAVVAAGVAASGPGDALLQERPPLAPSALIEIECAPERWAAECLFEGVDPDARFEVRVRAKGATAAGTFSSAVEVFSGSQQVTVGVRRQPVPVVQKSAVVPQEGRYIGTAWPLASGFPLRANATAVERALRGLRVPVTVIVHAQEAPSAFVVTIQDNLGGVILPGGQVTGRLAPNDLGGWDIRVPEMAYTRDANDAVTTTLRLNSVDESVRWADGLLEGQIDATYLGLTGPDETPRVRWQLAVTWVGAVEGPAEPIAMPVPSPDIGDALAQAVVNDQAYLTQLEQQILGVDSAEDVQRLACDGELLGLELDDPAVGDLACASGTPMRMFPQFGRLDASELEPLIEACLAEMATDAAPAEEAAQCVDMGRLKLALNTALSPDRLRALQDDVPGPEAIVARALGHRMVQQWLGLQGFLVTEAHNVVQLADALAGDGEAFATAIDLAEVYDAAIAGWDLLLHPRHAAALAVTPGNQLRLPDYRVRLNWDGVVFPTHEQPVGLPVALVSAMQRQLQASRTWLVDAYTGREEKAVVVTRVMRLVRRGWIVLALAQGLEDNAAPGNSTAWDLEWSVERARLGSTLVGLTRDIDAFEKGANPLGIDELDLPLNRVGDQEGNFGRFSAASQFLLGDSNDDQGALVPERVRRAIDELEAVRDDWTDKLRRNWDQSAEDNAQLVRIRAVHEKYGGNIWAACSQIGDQGWNSIPLRDGSPGILDDILKGLETSCDDDSECLEKLATGAGFDCLPNSDGDKVCQVDPKTCFFAESDPTCGFSDTAARSRLSTADLGYEMCFLGALRRRLGPEVSTGNINLDRRIDVLFRVPRHDLPFNDDEQALMDDWRQAGTFPVQPGVTGINQSSVKNSLYGEEERPSDRTRFGLPSAYIERAQAQCNSRRAAHNSQRPTVRPASCFYTDSCPLGEVCDGARGNAASPDAVRGTCKDELALERAPECYLGLIGQSALAVLGAAKDVDIARSQLNEHMERYDIAMRSCIIQQLGNEVREDALAAHNDTMSDLATVKLAADVTANVAAGVKDKGGIEDNFFSGGTQAAGAAVEAAAKSVSDGMQFAMDEAERKHAEVMLALENDILDRRCFNDAEMELVGSRTSSLAVERAANELAARFGEKQILEVNLSADILEGTTSLLAQQEARVAPIATDYWLSESIERYARTLRDAQRATYLALRAVEYEFQQTLGAERLAVLSARDPYALRDVQDRLRAETANGALAGSRPSGGSIVVSLKQQILQPNGPLGVYLADRTRRVLDEETGADLGLVIPFSLYPSRFASAEQIALLAGSDCAERIWSINATITGTNLLVASETSLIPFEVHKKNTFHSQWCVPPADADAPALQTASVRPSRNLFLNPVFD